MDLREKSIIILQLSLGTQNAYNNSTSKARQDKIRGDNERFSVLSKMPTNRSHLVRHNRQNSFRFVVVDVEAEAVADMMFPNVHKFDRFRGWLDVRRRLVILGNYQTKRNIILYN